MYGRRKIRARVIAMTRIVSALAVASVAGTPAAGVERTNDRDGITVKASYVSDAASKTTPPHALAGKVDTKRYIVFRVELDTHFGDLTSFDFVKNVYLRTDRGQRFPAVRWVSTADSSHHRAGGLLLQRTDHTRKPIQP